jgi:hypothetical protein
VKTPATPRYSIDNGELALAANVALDRLGLSDGDALLVVSNPELVEIATELAEAARARTQNVCLQEIPPTSRDGEEPPDAVATAMCAVTAIALVTNFSLSHTEARQAATLAGARIASLPGITEEIFARTLPIDYTHLEQAGRRLAEKLTEAKLCRVTGAGGTNVQISLQGRQAICDDGICAPRAHGATCRPARLSSRRSRAMATGRSSSTDHSPGGDSLPSRCPSSSSGDVPSLRRAERRPSGC